jgi:hypothetical protein
MNDEFESASSTEQTVREYLLSPHGANLSAADVQAVMSTPNSFLQHGLKEGFTARRIGDGLVRGWRLIEQREQGAAKDAAAAQAHLDARGGFDSYEEWFDARDDMAKAEAAVRFTARSVNEWNEKYPKPDRSHRKPQPPDIEAAHYGTVMNDGRSAVIEDWWSAGFQILFRTAFYSTLGTDSWSEADHYSYIEANGLLEGKTYPGKDVGMATMTDDSGNKNWTSTIPMRGKGEPDAGRPEPIAQGLA